MRLSDEVADPSHREEKTMQISMSRRGFLAAVPAAAIVSGCVPGAMVLDGNWGRFAADTSRLVDHTAWDTFLNDYLVQSDDGVNRVRYAAAASADPLMLKPYLASLENVDLAGLGKDEQMAFWINLYNAATVDLILQKPTIGSIRDLGPLTLGPWDKKVATVAGTRLSLNNIEHGILRPIWQDVRIHYAVNCASIGCPNLAQRAYTAADLETMLEQAARDYINHPRGFAMVNGGLTASSIYNWYASDWGTQANILDHARRYARGETGTLLDGATQIDRFDYDWALNAA
jgi:hypothetical protein